MKKIRCGRVSQSQSQSLWPRHIIVGDSKVSMYSARELPPLPHTPPLCLSSRFFYTNAIDDESTVVSVLLLATEHALERSCLLILVGFVHLVNTCFDYQRLLVGWIHLQHKRHVLFTFGKLLRFERRFRTALPSFQVVFVTCNHFIRPMHLT